VQSCFVPGPTITTVGFQNIINNPPIARRLFNKGFKKRLGFSYWDRSNSLTDKLFRGFDPSLQMFKVDEFKDVLITLNKISKEQTFVQIVINGLDNLCHRHRGRPPVAAIARFLYDDILLAIAEKLKGLGATALIYAVSDHGILWKPEVSDEDEFVVIKDERTHSRRYAKGTLIHAHSRNFTSHGSNYTSLAYPYLFSPLNSLEWGIHGGISYQESVVPFVKLEVF